MTSRSAIDQLRNSSVSHENGEHDFFENGGCWNKFRRQQPPFAVERERSRRIQVPSLKPARMTTEPTGAQLVLNCFSAPTRSGSFPLVRTARAINDQQPWVSGGQSFDGRLEGVEGGDNNNDNARAPTMGSFRSGCVGWLVGWLAENVRE